MNLKSIRLSERQQVLLVIPVVLVALAIVWFLVLAPKFERRREIERLRDQLQKSPYAAQSMENLLKIAAHERELGDQTKAEWEATVARLATLHAPGAELKAVGRIDYKMELFKARSALSRRSEELGVQLVPQDLGLRDTLGAGAGEVKVRWLQLKTVEKLVDTILGRQVFKLHAISPLDPIPHKGRDKKLLFTEYPVDVDFEVAFEDLYIFFQSILEEDRVFFIRNMRIRAGTVPGDPLRVEAVLSSAIFE
ncbi:MAG: hypothetical protein IJQ73_14280 [Kiritimatiellae bacterium]|nr:hypothetical protein [Kiritimatiellia bacterium]